jgi:chemotaxis protein methyltransferase CheR
MDSFLEKILAEVRKLTGMDFAQYRQKTVVNRVANRMADLGHRTTKAYWRQLQGNGAECLALTEYISINVSCFFRNPIVFEILAQRVLPELLEKKRKAGSQEMRIWSAGCASGEEPYSVAILLHQLLTKEQQEWTVHIFATDTDESSLDQARTGVYSKERLEDAKLGLVRQYFHPKGEDFEILPEIRDMVLFSRDDLTSSKLSAPADSVFGGFDLIFCRNVLIYLKTTLQSAVCKKLGHSLNNGGFLILGEAEHLPRSLDEEFMMLGDVNRIFKKRG